MEHYAAKAYKGLGMEGGIARWYAKNTLRDSIRSGSWRPG